MSSTTADSLPDALSESAQGVRRRAPPAPDRRRAPAGGRRAAPSRRSTRRPARRSRRSPTPARQDVDAAVRAARAAFTEGPWAAMSRGGARAADARARPGPRGPRRGTGRARVARQRQARRRCAQGRRPAVPRAPALLRGLAHQDRGRDAPVAVQNFSATRAASLSACRPDHAVELPAADGRLEDRAGARGRLHDRAQARRADAADGAAPRRAGARGRAAARRAQRRHRATAATARRSSSTRASTRSPSPARPRSAARSAQGGPAALKRVTLELGGKSPNIILADADSRRRAQGRLPGDLLQLRARPATPARGCSCRPIATTSSSPALADAAGPAQLGRRAGPGDPARARSSRPSSATASWATSSPGREQGAELVAGGGGALSDSGGYFVQPTLFCDDLRRPADRARGDLRARPAWPRRRHARGGRRARQRREYGLAAGVWTRDVG